MAIRPYSLAAAAACAALAVFVTLSPWPASQPDAARADKGEPPVIHSVSPARPHCVLVKSEKQWARTLTIRGEDFDVDAERHLHLRFLGRGAFSIHFGLEVQWISSTEIKLDMALIEDHLRDEKQFPAIVRLTAGYSDNPRETYAPLSEWSDAFFIAKDEESCKGGLPGAPPSFPPSPPTRGLAGDLWADVILGQADFSAITPYEVVPHKVFNPGGVVVDRSVDPGRAYIWDSGNSRILGIDLAKCYAGEGPCSADIVLGQPSAYDHSACNGDGALQGFPLRALAGPDTLCGIPDTAISPLETHTFVTMAVNDGGDLFTPDSFNHRILRYEDPFENDASADGVWGQADFSGILCNRGLPGPTAGTLCFHYHPTHKGIERYSSGVAIDAGGNLWVADGGNNRVLRFLFDPDTGEVAKVADLVLGQPDFESAEPGGPKFKELHAPSAVAFDRSGLLYVADTGNDRVLVFEPPFETGMWAKRKIDGEFRRPSSVVIDPTTQGVWVNDTGNGMVELWDPAAPSLLTVVGKQSYEPDGKCGHALGNFCVVAGGVDVDSRGNLLVALSRGYEVLRFPAPFADPVGGGYNQSDRALFVVRDEPNYVGGKGMRDVKGVAVRRDQLIVAGKRRLMFWNDLDALVSGQPADGVVGDAFPVDEWPSCCARIKADTAGRLWVIGYDGREYIDVYQLPLNESSVPIHTIRIRETSFPVLGADGRVALSPGIDAVAPVGQGEFLWVTDRNNHRVLRIRDPLVNPVVDVILGQENAEGNRCNRGMDPNLSSTASGEIIDSPIANTLCFPGALSIDRLGSLYVSDHSLEVQGNRRLLIFPAEATPTDNPSVIFAPGASKTFTHFKDSELVFNEWNESGPIDQLTSQAPAATWEPAFDSTNRMVVGYNAYGSPRFVGVYDDPTGPDLLPTAYLYDVGSMPFAAAFDKNDNLYVGDLNRSRVLIYRNPFNNTPQQVPQSTPGPPVPPAPEHPITIRLANPAPPYCVLRESPRAYETTLEFVVDGLPDVTDLEMEFRKITAWGPEHLLLIPEFIQDDGSRIVIPQILFWERLWPHISKVTLTARITGSDGRPLSNWSPAFLIADGAQSCGVALPTPTPTPTPTPEPTPTPTPEPTPTPTPEPTPTPTPEPTLTPTPEPTPTPTPELTPTPTPELTPTPTPELTPTPTSEPTPTPTPEPTPTPASEPTPTPAPEPTPTPAPELAATPTATPEPTPTPSAKPTPAVAPMPFPPEPEGSHGAPLRLIILAAGAFMVAVAIVALYVRGRRR